MNHLTLSLAVAVVRPPSRSVGTRHQRASAGMENLATAGVVRPTVPYTGGDAGGSSMPISMPMGSPAPIWWTPICRQANREAGQVYVLICTYMVHFEWDERKNRSNLDKHGIDFETAQWVFEDPLCVTFVERTEADEERWHGIGSIEGLILLVVVHTYRQAGDDQIIRIISARQATRQERKLYEATHR